ncbi:BatA domain-containing protein [bacterium]|nr:BatA domain-containing protein [bacterium]
MLNFLNIAALAALAGVAVPLLIHLFARRKAGTILFSSLKFFRAIESQAIRRLKMTELILLVLRTLAVFCIVSAFARPVLKGPGSAAGRNGSLRSAIVLDRSASTDAAGPYSRLQQGALSILNAAGEDTRTALFWSDTLGAGLSAADAASLRRSILEHDDPTLRRGALGPALQRALTWVNSGRAAEREIVLLSDLQRTNLPLAPDTAAVMKNGGLVLFQPGIRPANIGITGCGLEKQILHPGRSVAVYVELTATGGEGPVSTAIRCVQNGKTAARRLVTLTAPGTRRFRIDLPAGTRGWNRCFAEIDPDRFEQDNRRYVAYRVPELIRVLLMGADKESLVLPELALSASDPVEPLFSIHAVAFADGAGTSFRGFDCVVLVDYPRLTPVQADELQEYIEKGGTCIFIPGNRIDLKSYDERFFLPLTGIRLRLQRAPEGYHSVGRIDRDHPIITPMFEHEYLPAYPLRVYAYLDFSGAPGRDILSLSGGAPFLREFSKGGGRCLVFSSGLDAAWSNLPLTTVFAPLLFQCVLYGGSGGDVPAPSAAAGEAITCSGEVSLVRRELRAVTPGGETIRLTGAVEHDMMTLTLTGTDDTGIYDIFAGDSLLTCAAVNLDPDESVMDFHDKESLQRLYPSLTIDSMDPAKPVEAYLRGKRYGRELWREVLIAALLLLGVEMGIAAGRVLTKQRSS